MAKDSMSTTIRTTCTFGPHSYHIIDGLDECSNAYLQCHLLLECVEAFRFNSNLDLRVLIASCPEVRTAPQDDLQFPGS